MKPKIVFVGHKYPHHGNYSGYDLIVNYANYSCKIYTERLFLLRLLKICKLQKLGIVRVSKYQIFNSTNFEYRILKILALLYAFTSRKSWFHFIYPETGVVFNSGFFGSRHKYVATIHLPVGSFNKLSEKIKSTILNVDKIITMSKELESFFKKNHPAVKFIPHGINTNYFTPSIKIARKDKLLLVGNWQRNFPLAREVFIQLHNINSAIEIVTICLPENQQQFRDLSFIITQTGISDEELLEHYQSAKVVFLPLFSSSANNAILEAIATGCKVLIHSEQKDESYFDASHINFVEGDSKNIANQINMAISNFSEQDQINSIDFVRANYSWEKIAELTREFILS